MNGQEYLASLPAYVINLDRSTDRRRLIDVAIAPYVGEVVRVPGIDGKHLPQRDIDKFRIQVRDNPLLLDESIGRSGKPRGDQWLRGLFGCYQSHVKAMEMALADGREEFMVLEDDARFYRPDLAAATPAPDKDGCYVWGGAIPGGSTIAHLRKYIAWNDTPNEWKLIRRPDRSNRRLATAYSFTNSAMAETWLGAYRSNPHVSDVAWWTSMSLVPTFAPGIEVLMQDPQIPTQRDGQASNLRLRFTYPLLLESIIG